MKPTLSLRSILPMASLSVSLAVVAFGSVACKESEKKEDPKPKATATAVYTYGSSTPANPPPAQPPVAPVPPSCDTTVYECAPDPKIVELCKKQEQDDTKCGTQIDKALYNQLKGQVGSAETVGACKSTRYVNTQTDPANIRNQPSLAGDVLGVVDRTGSLCVLASTSAADGAVWYKLNFGGKVGYVFGAITSETKPAAAPAPIAGGTTQAPVGPECGKSFAPQNCKANRTYVPGWLVRCVAHYDPEKTITDYKGDAIIENIDRSLCLYPTKTEKYMRVRLTSITSCYVLERDVNSCAAAPK